MPSPPARSPKSWLGVPILVADEVLGVLALESLEKNAYDDSTERLLATVASSMGVALNNARLFDETKRLLTETDERAAELAIINSVQQGLAAQLDIQAMYDLVGEQAAARSSTPRWSTSALFDKAAGRSTSRTPSSGACASRTSRSPASASGST